MSGSRSSFGMSSAELKLQKSRALRRTYLLSNSMLPHTSVPSIGESLKFPSLLRTTQHWTSMVPLSITEPSLFNPGQQMVFQAFSRNRPSPWKRTSSLPPCKSFKNTEDPPKTHHPIYTHFSRPLRPIPKLDQPTAPAQRLTFGQCGLQPLVKQHCQLPHEKTLSVRGTRCLPSQPLPTTAIPANRTQLHVFLPVERAEDEEDGDSKSINEGFIDDTDSKITTLWHQQRGRKTPQPGSATAIKTDLVQLMA